MQGSEPEKKSKSRSDEDSINFRPSPNFKHMRKYLKSKFEEANQMANPSASNGTSDASVRLDEREKVSKNAHPVVQPPLPPNPPPPESPPIINLKQEVVDDEYGTTQNNADFNQPESLLAENIKTDRSEVVSNKPEVAMCRNFARGTCKKGAACIFAHELILSQLPGVYTFCRNFQNSVCTFPKCKFVHATVFEKEHFFRTGYLPPHTLSHLKENNVLQPPPPPPPPEETPTEAPQLFVNDLPPQAMPGITTVPVMTCAAAPTVETAHTNIFGAGGSATSSPKREWSDSDEFSSSPRDLDSSEPLAKKCKNCDKNEFRYQYNKFKVEKMMRSTEEINTKMAALNKKSSRLYTVLVTLLKPGKSAGGTNGLNVSPDKGEDKLQSLIANPNNVSALLAKYLLSNGNPAVPPDSS